MSKRSANVNGSNSDSSSDEEELQAFKKQIQQKSKLKKGKIETDNGSNREDVETEDDYDLDESCESTSSDDEGQVLAPSKRAFKPQTDSSSEEENYKVQNGNQKKLKTLSPDDEEKERMAFRSELSQMSLEEILSLKQKVGIKAYNRVVDDVKRSNKRRQEFKRENKNRPREATSKVTVSRLRDVVGIKAGLAKPEKRDPRFDAISGEFDEKIFKKSYEFVEEIKSQEKRHLKKELETEQDPDRIKQIKYLIQRMENQEREKLKVTKAKEIRSEEKKRNRDLIKEGKKPVFLSNAERKAQDLVKQYEDLTQNGKLDNYIKRKEKKNLSKDRKKMKV